MSQLYSTLPPQPHPQDASVSQMQEYSATEVPTLGSNAQSDPAALLRQAALSSRKLKRRKLDTTALPAPIPSSLARPVAPTSSIVLDYGQEESSSATPTSESVPSAPAMTSSSSSSSAHMPPPSIVQMNSIIGSALAAIPDDDASAREEGEISEGEETPSPTFRRSIPPPIANTTFIAPVEVTTPAHSSFTPLSRSPSVLTEEAYQRAVTPASTATSARRHSTTAVTTPKTPAALDSARLETPLYVLDEDHVRPGLTITQKEYDKVKEIVLDLLGYGVTPEYLVDCGLSREIIFYVFTELNLRLPSNLDTSGIPPYPPPPDVIASILASHFNPAYSSILPAKPTGDEAALPRTPGHPLPPRPHVSQSSAPLPQVQATSFDASASVAVLELSESALSVMEQQRKQELLARKAVQASRKRKEPASPASTLPSTSPARSAKTEDTPESALNFDVGNAFPTPRVDSPEPMNVDDEIPGFGGHLYSEYNPLPRPSVDALSGPSPPGAMSMPESFDELRPTEGNRTEAALPPRESPQAADEAPSRASSEGTPAPQPMGDGDRDVRRSSDTPQPTAPVPRRGTKRPVASDFDSEPVSKTFTPPVVSRTGSGFGFSTYASTFHPNPHVRRKMNAAAAAGGFAGLIVQRRCVIDVSDSEEESSDDEAPPTTPAPSTPSDPSPRDSALALEQEIERMRRLIREREELQLRKQVMSSGRSTPASRTAPAASATSEQPSERAASSSTSESEISRSATERDTLPKNGGFPFQGCWESGAAGLGSINLDPAPITCVRSASPYRYHAHQLAHLLTLCFRTSSLASRFANFKILIGSSAGECDRGNFASRGCRREQHPFAACPYTPIARR
ncbi:hypothetical protein BC834DRAFT_569084 [Gloeopeniophorella convolvens]|nr:hypothetical protein BC834DRAFT_569084 [Gloeopeniophorella convolvens]